MTISANKTGEAMPVAGDLDDDSFHVAVVGPGDDEASYEMFEVREITNERAFLTGPHFFEVDEEFSLELGAGGGKILLRARVVELERGDAPGMAVVFADLNEAESKLIAELAARLGED